MGVLGTTQAFHQEDEPESDRELFAQEEILGCAITTAVLSIAHLIDLR
jgi:hypothetical protein